MGKATRTKVFWSLVHGKLVIWGVYWVLHNCNVATETTRGVGRIVYLHHRSLFVAFPTQPHFFFKTTTSRREITAPSMGKIEINFTVKSIICKYDWLLLILGTPFMRWHIICSSCEKKTVLFKSFFEGLYLHFCNW